MKSLYTISEIVFILTAWSDDSLPFRWDDLWLNEGFASFVEYLGTDKAEPEFEVGMF